MFLLRSACICPRRWNDLRASAIVLLASPSWNTHVQPYDQPRSLVLFTNQASQIRSEATRAVKKFMESEDAANRSVKSLRNGDQTRYLHAPAWAVYRIDICILPSEQKTDISPVLEYVATEPSTYAVSAAQEYPRSPKSL